jgi:hypothetical protein
MNPQQRQSDDTAILELLSAQTRSQNVPLEDILGRLLGIASVLALTGSADPPEVRAYLHELLDEVFTWYDSQINSTPQ